MNDMHAEQRMGMAMGQNPEILSEVITFFCVAYVFRGHIVWCWNESCHDECFQLIALY